MRLPPVPRSVRVELAALLSPRIASLETLSQLAERLRALEEEQRASRTDAHQLLLEGCVATLPAMVRLIRAQTSGLGEEVAEDVAAELCSRIGAVYDQWTGAGSFRAYLARILSRAAWSAAARERAHQREVLDAPPVETTEEPDPAISPIQVQALRRFAWYLYGSPDNPNRVRSDKALVDFLAFSARLEGRPFSDLVRDLQPRPGSWDLGRGEADCKWWRGRAQMAQARIQKALQQRHYRAVYERIVAELTEAHGAATAEGVERFAERRRHAQGVLRW